MDQRRVDVVVAPDDRAEQTVVVAIPLTEVRESLDRLVIIEAAAALVLLSLLAAGSWLRRLTGGAQRGLRCAQAGGRMLLA